MSCGDSDLHRVPPGYLVHGHAIVSADDMIADDKGRTPPSLRNKEDWRRFQAALDAAAVTVLGRLGHELHPSASPKRRHRIVVSGRFQRLERIGDAWWWNPACLPLHVALERAAPGGGIVAVPGGQRVFDLFLSVGYDEFHLARAERVVLKTGRTLFSDLGNLRSAVGALRAASLVPDPPEWLDPEAAVSLTVWRRLEPAP